ncbi:MAG TPA: type II toxin-antitoxin system VapC family toxin [Conexibacter sp.]|nr:type II toxin-antitoxin system VapC family toxin [Conexibacter sp.]
MAELKPDKGLLDTSVLIDLDAATSLPGEALISTLSVAELAAGPHAVRDAAERARRQQRIQWAESSFEALPFDEDCARAYGGVFAAAASIGRKPRGSRALDLLIAATAIAHDLPLYTFNVRDLAGLDSLLEVVDVGTR